MKNTIIFFSLFMLAFSACTKNDSANTTYVNSALKKDYGYKTGSYWIYKDSVSGTLDSAYVYNSVDSFYPVGGCVLRNNPPLFEAIHIYIRINDGNPNDSESWQISMRDSTFNISFTSNHDNIENGLGYKLFTYPIRTGQVFNSGGCLLSLDSGGVADIINEMALNNNSYTNTGACNRSQQNSAFSYNDWFYVSPDAGFVKLIFNHPTASVYRVLELQRYKIVK